MNIIEAAKTGLPMRRKAWPFPWEVSWCRYPLEREDIVADDWEVDEPKVTITRRELERALSKHWEHVELPMDRIAKELGL